MIRTDATLALKRIDEYLQEVNELQRISYVEGGEKKDQLMQRIRSFIRATFADAKDRLDDYDRSFGKVWIGGLDAEKTKEQDERHYRGDLKTMQNHLLGLKEEITLQSTPKKEEAPAQKHTIYVDAGYKKDSGGYIAWFNETTGEAFAKPNDCKDSFRCEYTAIIHLLENARGLGQNDEVQIRCDNNTVVRQLNHDYAINDNDIRDFVMKIWSFNEKFAKPISYVWIPRAENKAGKILGS